MSSRDESKAAPPAPQASVEPESKEAAAGATRRNSRVYMLVRFVCESLDCLREQLALYLKTNPPTLGAVFGPALFVAAVLYVRSPLTNCIFDEQEALLANPFVNGQELGWFDAFRRDFWGLPPTRSIGSYRPLPNLVWRALWPLGQSPWLLHWVNVVVHALTAALLGAFALAVTARRRLGWWVAASYVAMALLTEAVAGVVGLADVLGALLVVMGLHALRLSLPLAVPAVLLAVFGGLCAKESVLVAVPLLPLAALWTAPSLHPNGSRSMVRALAVLVSTVAALAAYTEMRRRLFPFEIPSELLAPLPANASHLERAFRAFLKWFQQPRLPIDPMNNPLADAAVPERIAGALRVYLSGLCQIVWPASLSGDYSFPAELPPKKWLTWEAVLGGALTIGPPLVAIALMVRIGLRRRRMSRWLLGAPRGSAAGAEATGAEATGAEATGAEATGAEATGAEATGAEATGAEATGAEATGAEATGAATRRAEATGAEATGAATRRAEALRLVALALVWVPVAYFPHSNIPVLLPTVRAERFWVLPALGAAFILGFSFDWISRRRGRWARRVGLVAICVMFAIQGLSARLHALDYTDDLTFWQATVRAVPKSAKAHLNYAVMLGARQRMDERLIEGAAAIRLAPEWPMAYVYQGDTLCRMGRIAESIPFYLKGMRLGPNEPSLIALGLQCLWDAHSIEPFRADFLAAAADFPQSWLAFLVDDLMSNGETYGGVQPQYRPRGYNEGPKK